MHPESRRDPTESTLVGIRGATDSGEAQWDEEGQKRQRFPGGPPAGGLAAPGCIADAGPDA